MKRILTAAGVIVAIICIGGVSYAGSTVDQIVQIEVSAINEVAVSGNISGLAVNIATPGSNPTPANNNSTTISFTTNDITSTKYLKAKLNSDLPGGITLKLTCGDPGTNWDAAAQQTLSSTDATIASGTAGIAASAVTLTYELSADATAGKLEATDKTVTFTLSD
jgi:hypothetical protein